MKLGVCIEETWAFFEQVYAEFEQYHQVSLFEPRQANPPLLKGRINQWLAARDLQAFLGSNHVVFFEWASRYLEAATRLPKTCGIVARMHRYEMYQWADKIDWEKVDRLIVVSQAKREEFSTLFPEHADRVVVIPEAISLDRFNLIEKPFRGDLGILCHLSPRKRVYELIITFAELVERGNDLHLHIGGAAHGRFPDYEPAVRALVQKLGIQEQITFYGKVTDASAWYANIDMFISNSFSEGLQVSPMEAIASGCYCISHWWDGADELLPVENLYLTDTQLIEKIETFYSTSENDQRERQRQLYARIADKFNIDAIKVLIREQVEETAFQHSDVLEAI